MVASQGKIEIPFKLDGVIDAWSSKAGSHFTFRYNTPLAIVPRPSRGALLFLVVRAQDDLSASTVLRTLEEFPRDRRSSSVDNMEISILALVTGIQTEGARLIGVAAYACFVEAMSVAIGAHAIR